MRAFTAVVNPISGGGRASAVWEPLAGLLAAEGAAVRTEQTRSREHAIECATAAARRGDVVVAVGGDGLVRDVAAGVVAAGADGTMAIVPAGRGNDLAQQALRIPDGTSEIARLLLEGPARSIDVLDVNGVIAPGNVYIGIDSMATRVINANRWVPPLLLYRLAPVRAMLTWSAPTYTVTVDDGEPRSLRAHTVVAANSGAYGHGLRIVPPAVLDDGLLHLLEVGDGPRWKMAQFMSQAKQGTHIHRPEVGIHTARTVTIDADRPVPVCADGDEIARLPAVVRVLPAALKVIAPA